VVRAWIEGDRLIVELRLFGDAIAWRNEAAMAMLMALRGGIALRAGRRAQRRRVEPLEVLHEAVSGVGWEGGAREGVMRFRTPLSLRRRHTSVTNPLRVLPAVLGRVRRLAPWQGCALRLPVGWLDTAQIAARIEVEDWRTVRWERFTRNQGPVAVPVSGQIGQLRLRQLGEDAGLMLAIAETCNVGSHAALDMGWFDWIPT
jgi:hypothetical protein